MLNLDAALGQLYAEKKRLDTAIEQLSLLQAAPDIPRAPGRRGRKAMGEEERLKVSKRMQNYWAQRRQQKECGVPSVREARTVLAVYSPVSSSGNFRFK